MYLVSNQLFIIRTIPCATFKWITSNNNNFTSIVIALYTSFTYNNHRSLEFYRFELILFSFYTQRVFIQDSMNSFWTKCRIHTRLNYNRNSRVVLTHDSLNSNWINVACCFAFYIPWSAVWWIHLKENVSGFANSL